MIKKYIHILFVFRLVFRTRPLETSSLSLLPTTDTIRSDSKEKRVSFTCAPVANLILEQILGVRACVN